LPGILKNTTLIATFLSSDRIFYRTKLRDRSFLVSSPEFEWYQQSLNGDQEAYGMLVEKYQTPVYNLCYRMLGDPLEAEDAAQETFWRAYQALKRYDPQRSFATWLLSIAAHYCIDQQRRRKLPSVEIDALPEDILPDGGAPDPERETTRSEQDRVLYDLLRSLNPPDRAALVLRYWYDFSDEEIGQTLSLSVSAVKSRLHRAKLLLAQRWQASQPQTLLRREPA
jgi:RNA polymerase sigma-70 factor (ECF subfamily)